MGRNLIAALIWCGAFASVAAIAFGDLAAQNKNGGSAADARANVTAEIAAGKIVYDAQCEACHFPHSAAKKVGPGLKGIYRRGKFADGRAVSDASMSGWIRNGGKNMPPLAKNLSADEIRGVLAYLHTL